MATIDDFRSELRAQIRRAEARGAPHVEVNAGELHRQLGGIPAPSIACPFAARQCMARNE